MQFVLLVFFGLTGYFNSYNKFSQITARALRNSLKEGERLLAEKRGLTSVRYQKWENGVGGPQVRVIPILPESQSNLTFSRLC